MLLFGALGTPAVAKKRPMPSCSGRFILAESPDPKVGSTPTSTLLIGSYYVNSGGGTTSGVTQGLNASDETLNAEGRSTTTDVVLPPAVACSSSHAGHAGVHVTPLGRGPR
jgi:hypothetical protein